MALASLLLGPATRAGAGEVVYGLTSEVASGTYGLSERTVTVLVEPFVGLAGIRWRATAWLPVTYRSTPFVTYSGHMMVPTGGQRWHEDGHEPHHGPGGDHQVPPPSTIEYQRVGFADPLLRVDWSLRARGWAAGLGAFVAIKPPLANESEGFSTGAWDGGAGIVFARRLGSTDIWGEISYWRLGDTATLELEDTVAASLLVRLPLSWRFLDVAATARASTAAVSDPGAPVELGVVLTRPGRSGLPTLAVRFGVTSSSPDVVVSLAWAFSR
ncbi:MAG: hypothetical protein HY900_14655 [Deltaproteobacteria bacterium]|nr:hypothetical protein [Deltaproteobacteria bacterium]